MFAFGTGTPGVSGCFSVATPRHQAAHYAVRRTLLFASESLRAPVSTGNRSHRRVRAMTFGFVQTRARFSGISITLRTRPTWSSATRRSHATGTSISLTVSTADARIIKRPEGARDGQF
jgi:hypothetical protein